MVKEPAWTIRERTFMKKNNTYIAIYYLDNFGRAYYQYVTENLILKSSKRYMGF